VSAPRALKIFFILGFEPNSLEYDTGYNYNYNYYDCNGDSENAGTENAVVDREHAGENAGLENAGPNRRGGKRRTTVCGAPNV